MIGDASHHANWCEELLDILVYELGAPLSEREICEALLPYYLAGESPGDAADRFMEEL